MMRNERVKLTVSDCEGAAGLKLRGRGARFSTSALSLLLVVMGVGLTRAVAQIVPPSPYWKNRIAPPHDPFITWGQGNEPRWVKFTILLSPYDPAVVYFQDSNRFPFHYDFAVECLPPFAGMTRQEFDLATLYSTGQKAVLGAVLVPHATSPSAPLVEYGIQLVRRDAFSKEEVRDLFQTLGAAIQTDPGVVALYLPTYEQQAAAEADREWLASQGIEIASTARWATGNACYAEGWALGTLRYVPGADIAEAYRQGFLQPDDILLTDGVPAEVPMVAGILSLSPSTPNSHVAILAGTYGVPFAWLAIESDAARASALVGRRVLLRARGLGGNGAVDLFDTQFQLDDRQTSELLALKIPPPLELSPMASLGTYSQSADSLLPSDVRYFGGKAANFGILRASIPDNSPHAIAFSFDLWNEFLDQTVVSGKTLRGEIADRLAQYQWPPVDMAALSDELADIRDLFTNTARTSFSPTLENAVLNALADPGNGFSPLNKIRFRSSTNVEDTAHFTGAGLYDSYSGCLADDLDADTAGPSLCDPTEAKERGVFRAIRKVYASFYNTNAFLARLRHRVDESEVGMALLVHHSFPDDIELANGVATLKRTGPDSRTIRLVTQLGAVSVANPEGGAIPEDVVVYSYSTYEPTLHLIQPSSLVLLGDTVMVWKDDYLALVDLLIAADRHYAQIAGKTGYTLDFEYKKTDPLKKMIVKQVRELPGPDTSAVHPSFLLNAPMRYKVFQGEFGNVFANHRLKSWWSFETRNLWLTSENRAHCFLADTATTFSARGEIRTRRGNPSEWTDAAHQCLLSQDESTFDSVDSWRMDEAGNGRRWAIRADGWPARTVPPALPIQVLADRDTVSLEVKYDYPVPTWDLEYGAWSGGELTTTTLDVVRLIPDAPNVPESPVIARLYKDDDGVSITTRFRWVEEAGVLIKTSYLARWEETIIEGLTSRPIVLHGEFSQTYKPEHHNFSEHFLFEPRLEPRIDPALLDELDQQGICMIHFYFDQYEGSTVRYLSCDDTPIAWSGSAWMLY